MRKGSGLMLIPNLCLLHCTVRANQTTVHLINDQVTWMWNRSIVTKTEMESWTPSEIHNTIELCAKDLGYYELKLEQHRALTAFFKNAGCVCLVTYGVLNNPLFPCPSWNVKSVERGDKSVYRRDVSMVDIDMDCRCIDGRCIDGRYQLSVSMVDLDCRSINHWSVVLLGSSLHISTVNIDIWYTYTSTINIAYRHINNRYPWSIQKIEFCLPLR